MIAKDKSLVIVGDAITAQIAYEYFTHDSTYRVAGFAVEKAYHKQESLFNLPVVAFEEIEKHFPKDKHHAYVALGYGHLNRDRTRLYQMTKAKGYTLANYISSRAFVWHNVTMGDNVFIFEDNTVQPFVELGSNIILWSGNHIGHHTRIGDNVFISSHVAIAGFCTIGEYSFMGVNASVANHTNIGKDNFIGFGVRIAKHTPDDTVLLPTPETARDASARRYCKVAE